MKKIVELISEEKKEQKDNLQKVVDQVIKLNRGERKGDNLSLMELINLIKQDQKEVSLNSESIFQRVNII